MKCLAYFKLHVILWYFNFREMDRSHRNSDKIRLFTHTPLTAGPVCNPIYMTAAHEQASKKNCFKFFMVKRHAPHTNEEIQFTVKATLNSSVFFYIFEGELRVLSLLRNKTNKALYFARLHDDFKYVQFKSAQRYNVKDCFFFFFFSQSRTYFGT